MCHYKCSLLTEGEELQVELMNLRDTMLLKIAAMQEECQERIERLVQQQHQQRLHFDGALSDKGQALAEARKRIDVLLGESSLK